MFGKTKKKITSSFCESLFSFSISFCSREEAHNLCKKYVQHIVIAVVVQKITTTKHQNTIADHTKNQKSTKLNQTNSIKM